MFFTAHHQITLHRNALQYQLASLTSALHCNSELVLNIHPAKHPEGKHAFHFHSHSPPN